MPAERAFAAYWERTRGRLEAELPRWIRRFFDGLPPSDRAAVHEALDGGKRVRGTLVCLVAEALGGTLEDALPRAVAIECVQAASLIHDDIVDGDAFRRERPAVWSVRGRRRAVLLGDLIFATALRRMIELSRRDGITLGGAIADMAGGAYREPLASPESVHAAHAHRQCGADFYPLIIYLKSGALFGAAARLGAHAAGCGEAAAALAFDYGVQIGEAYQIGDDLADLLGEKSGGRLEQLPLLEPLWRHFFEREECFAGQSAPTAAPCPETLTARVNGQHAVLRERMRGAMRARLGTAERTVDRLAPGGHAELLQTAPAAIVRFTGG